MSKVKSRMKRAGESANESVSIRPAGYSTDCHFRISIPRIYFGKGAPTAISHLWPSCPCGGFIPGAVGVAGCADGFNIAGVAAGEAGVWLTVTAFPGCGEIGGVAAFGGELKGAPTWMSQRCPGCPCAGFMPLATFCGCGGVIVCVAAGAETVAGWFGCGETTGTFGASGDAAAVGGASTGTVESCGSNSFLQDMITQLNIAALKMIRNFINIGLRAKYSELAMRDIMADVKKRRATERCRYGSRYLSRFSCPGN